MKTIFGVLLALTLTACGTPHSSLSTGASRPTLSIKGAPADAILVVDKLSIGQAALYNGEPNVLLVEEGIHQIEIRRGNATLHREEIVINNGESRTITVNTGVQ